MTPAERTAAQQRGAEIAELHREVAVARTAEPPASPEQLAALAGWLAASRRARDDAESDFFAAHPELRNRRPPAAGDGGFTTTASQDLLVDGRTAVLEYMVAENETLLFIVTKGSVPGTPPTVQAELLPLGRATQAGRVGAFRTILADRGMNWQADARSLGQALLAPAWASCADTSRLVIVPDGPLWELPFQALAAETEGKPTAPMRTLLETRSVSFAPSLTFLARTPAADVGAHPARLLAVGNPALAAASLARQKARLATVPDSVLMDEETVPLPDAERQVHALVALYGPGRSRTLIRKEAHENVFKELAGNYDVLHLPPTGSSTTPHRCIRAC